MKRMFYGIILGSILTLGILFLIENPFTTESLTSLEEARYEQMIHDLKMSKIENELYKDKYELLTKEKNKLVEDHQINKESRELYTDFVASLLHGDIDLKHEIISTNIKNRQNTAVVYAEEYIELPNNQDLQKLYLLLLVDQLDVLTMETVELWSNKEDALSYVSGEYEEDGLEGWTGENSRFGLLLKTGSKTYLSHILSVHERDEISVGKFTIE